MDILDVSGLWSVTSGAAVPVPPEPPIVVTVGGGSPVSRLRRLMFWRRIWGEPAPEKIIQAQADTPYLLDETLERLREIEEDDEDIISMI